MNEQERRQLEKAYLDACTFEDTGGRHWELMGLLKKLGRTAYSRQEALRLAEELLYGFSSDEERYLSLADEE